MNTPLLFIAFMLSYVVSYGASAEESSSQKITPTSSSSLIESASSAKPSKLTGNIQVNNRQLLVDGIPFVMKAICYSPVPQGKVFPEGLIFLAPTAADLAVIEKDFQMMHDAGINTVRTYIPMTNKHVLDLLTKYHLKTIVPVFNDVSYTPFSTISKTVSILKDHPSTLIWEIGNEWNYNNFDLKKTNVPNPQSTPSLAPSPSGIPPLTLLKNAIAVVREQDTAHPISTVIGDLPQDDHFWKSLPDSQIDLYGSNIYNGLDFGDSFKRWQKISTKPLYIGETGATAFNSNINAEDLASQAFAVTSLLTEIQNNLSAKNPSTVLIGGAIFEWNDEWWKCSSSPNVHGADGFYLIANTNGPGCQLRTYPQDAAIDRNIPKVSGPYPDHIFHEKWWGVVDIDRNIRPAYNVIKKFYTQ